MCFFFQAEDGIRDWSVTGVQTCALPICYDLTGAVLEDRKEALAEIVPHGSAGMIRYSDHQQGHGDEFHRHACQYDLRSEERRVGKSGNLGGRRVNKIKEEHDIDR